MKEVSQNEMIEALDSMIDLKNQLDDIVDELEQIIRRTFPRNYSRAQAYWLGHMKSAIGGYGYSSMCSLEDTLHECEELAYWDSEGHIADLDDEPGWREDYSRW